MPNPWTDGPTLAGSHVTLRPIARADRDDLLAASRMGLGRHLHLGRAARRHHRRVVRRHRTGSGGGRAMVFCVLDARVASAAPPG
jgi:hypothetical protein